MAGQVRLVRGNDVDDQPTCLWTLGHDGHEVSCLARLVPYGIEIDIAHDGSAVVTRVFETGEEALAWADKKRANRVAQGWTEVTTARNAGLKSDPFAT